MLLGLLLSCTLSDTPDTLTSIDLPEVVDTGTPETPGDTVPPEDSGEPDEPIKQGSAGADILIAVMLDTYRGDWMLEGGFTEPLGSRLQDDGWSIYPAATTSNWTWPSIRLMATGCGFFSNLEDPVGSCESFTVSENSDQQAGDIPMLPSLIDAKVFTLTNAPIWQSSHSDVCETLINQGGICEVQAPQPDGSKGNDRLVSRALELRDVLSESRNEDGKVVMFLHLFGPHDAYEHHPVFGECVIDTDLLPEGWSDYTPIPDTDLSELLFQLYLAEGEEAFGPAQDTVMAYFRCVYETDLAHTNAQVNRLLEGLGEEWMAENRAMVMLYNDHGERWGERHPDGSIPQNGVFVTGHGRSTLYENVTGGFGGMWIPWWEGTLPKTEAVPMLSAEDLWQTAYYHLNIDAPSRLGGTVIGSAPLGTPVFSGAVDLAGEAALVRAVWRTDTGERSLICTLASKASLQCEGYDLNEYSDLLGSTPPWEDPMFSEVWPELRLRLLSVAERLDWRGTLPE